MENYIVINGKKAELTKEQLKALGIKTNENPFDRAEHGNLFYNIGPDGKLYKNYECINENITITMYDNYYATANYCTDEKLLKQRALHETLNRLLWRFSCENGELKNEWDNSPKQGDCHYHYYIYFNQYNNLFDISRICMIKCEGIIYFSSYEIAKQALDEIVKPFIKEHPDFVW